MSEPPLEINERIKLDGLLYARFDGERVVIETHTGGGSYVLRMKISPIAMAHLFYVNRRISGYPAWTINLADIEDLLK